MGKVIETTIRRFDGGISENPRDPRENMCNMVTNFDIYRDPNRLVPYRDSEDADSSSANFRIQNFTVGLRTANTYQLFGLGVTTGQVQNEVYYKNFGTGGANDFDDASWTETASNASSSGTGQFDLFIAYQRLEFIYGSRDGTHIWRYDPDAPAFVDTHQAVTHTDMGQGIVHSKDDILYIPYHDNAADPKVTAIAKNDNGSWNNTAITLPSHFIINSICEFGNFLAIGAAPTSGVGNSRVFLWNRDSTLSTVTESIDWGDGVLKVLEEVNGELIGVSLVGGIGGASGVTFADRIIFRRYVSGVGAVKFKELVTGAVDNQLSLRKQKIDNKLYFYAEIDFNGAVRSGVWSIGKPEPGSDWVLAHERTPDDDVSVVDATLTGFHYVGDFLFQAYNDSGHKMTRTADTGTFSATSIYEKRFATDSPQITKNLLEATVMTEFLPTAGQIVLAFRVDQNTSFTTIFTEGTNNSISHSAINIESDGSTLPNEYKEIEFRIESTGNAVVTGLSFKEELTDKRPHG